MKVWTGIDRLSIIWKSDKIKLDFFPSCGWVSTTVWRHHMDVNKMHRQKARWELHKNSCYFEQILKATPHKTAAVWPLTSHQKNNPNKMNKTWRNMDELISDVLQWTQTHECASVGQPARTYLHQLYVDTGCSLEDLPGAMDDKDKWRKKESRKSMVSVQLDDDILLAIINNA